MPHVVQAHKRTASRRLSPATDRLRRGHVGIGGRVETGESLVAALQEAGVEFIPENGGGAGVRMKKRAARR